MAKPEYHFFWRRTILSNWAKASFIWKGITFMDSEQAMMWGKADIFGDDLAKVKILACTNPRDSKAEGRNVANFVQLVWDNRKYAMMKEILLAKLDQVPRFRTVLLAFKGKVFVEASPNDRIWGIGYEEHNALDNFDNWGENLLGKLLTEIANEL